MRGVGGGGRARHRYNDSNTLECEPRFGVSVLPTATEALSGFVTAVGHVE
jgi:hypothetical protein